MKDRLQELESQLKFEQESNAESKRQMLEREAELERANAELSSALAHAQRLLEDKNSTVCPM
jgi:hypothetical protein